MKNSSNNPSGMVLWVTFSGFLSQLIQVCLSTRTLSAACRWVSESDFLNFFSSSGEMGMNEQIFLNYRNVYYVTYMGHTSLLEIIKTTIKYELVIHKQKDSCFGVTVTDLPGCFSAGDTIEEALRNTEEAIQSHLEVLAEDDAQG